MKKHAQSFEEIPMTQKPSKSKPLKGLFGIMKFSRPTEEILHELDEEERQLEERKWREYKKRHPGK